MGAADAGVRGGASKSNGSSGSQTGSGYSTDVSDDNLPNDAHSPASEMNNNSDSDEQVDGQLFFNCLLIFLLLEFLIFVRNALCRMKAWNLMT